MQTEDADDSASGRLVTPANNFGVIRVQREVGRSNFGGIFVNREGTGDYDRPTTTTTAPTASTRTCRCRPNAKLFAFFARTDSPADAREAGRGRDYSGRVFYNFTNNLWQVSGGYSQVGDNFNPEVGFLPRRGYRRPEFRAVLPAAAEALAVDPPHLAAHQLQRVLRLRRRPGAELDGPLPLLRDPAAAGRTVRHVRRSQPGPADRRRSSSSTPAASASSFRRASTPGISCERVPERSERGVRRHRPRARMAASTTAISTAIETSLSMRAGARFIGSVGWTRQNIDLPYGTSTPIWCR